MKRTAVICLWALLYIRWVITGYFSPVRWQRMFATALLYMMMHYVIMSWRETIHKHGRYIMVYVILITGAVLYFTGNIWLALSSLLRHIAIGSVVYSLEEVMTNRRRFRTKEYFSTGWVLFSVFFTLSFITAFMGRNQTFTLSCEEIYDASHAVIRYSEDTLHLNVTKPILTGSNSEVNTGIYTPLTWSDDRTFASLVQTYKQQLIDDTIANQTNVNQKVCQVFIDQIKELYTKPGFRVSVILLMFLVISPLLRITLFIISAINTFIFTIFKKTKVYKVIKEMREVDKVV